MLYPTPKAALEKQKRLQKLFYIAKTFLPIRYTAQLEKILAHNNKYILPILYLFIIVHPLLLHTTSNLCKKIKKKSNLWLSTDNQLIKKTKKTI